MKLNRIEAFSDGVFAIIVTLLVLELKVPQLQDAASTTELASRLVDVWPMFLSWLISFIIVCKFWLNHHYILSLARKADYGMVWLNSLFLLCQSFVPFPTALMGQYATNPLAVSYFGQMMALNTMIFMLLQRYIMRNLLKPEFEGKLVPHILIKALVGPASYLAGALSAWWSVEVAFGIYMLTPLFYIVPPEIIRDRPPPRPEALRVRRPGARRRLGPGSWCTRPGKEIKRERTP